MTINDREIILITYSTEKNWIADIPKNNWLCVLVDNDRTRNYMDEVISKIINNDVCWICCVGESSEKTNDLIENEIQFRRVDIDNLHLPKHNIMTTSYQDFKEGIWFAIFAANHEHVDINKVVILDMTGEQQIAW